MNKSFQALCARLQAAGVPDARFDAAQLYRFVTGRDPRLDDGPDEEEARRLKNWRYAAPHGNRCSICWGSGFPGFYPESGAGSPLPAGRQRSGL